MITLHLTCRSHHIAPCVSEQEMLAMVPIWVTGVILSSFFQLMEFRFDPLFMMDNVFIVAAVLAVVSRAWWGSWLGPPFGLFVFAVMAYTFIHLGLSFVLSAILATPGCEMRAIPHLWTLVTGRATKEHYCPGFLDGLDKWELSR